MNKITFLRDLGFNVSEITVTLKSWSDKFIEKQFEHKPIEIAATIKSKQDIKQKKLTINYNVSIKSIPSHEVFSLRQIVSDYYTEGYLWKELSAFADKNSIPVSSNTFTIKKKMLIWKYRVGSHYGMYYGIHHF